MQQLELEQLNECCNLLNQDEIVVIPTDTIYGLSARYSEQNAQKINELKRSALDKPLIILVASLEQAAQFIKLTQASIRLLESMEPTTVIDYSHDQQKTFAIRLVKRADIKKIIDKCGPIFSTSVNNAGTHYLSNKHELENFVKKNNCFYVGQLGNKPSKIFDLTTNSKKR